ncbi:GatB/YqeY domain-containing protein [Liquorilactobacillus satsumensis]|uniref:GatB/YqeY domain-containing protein n=1 Tax=Liquorilactobacillus satsumensis TaxID=259059 RepID=UPI0039E9D195
MSLLDSLNNDLKTAMKAHDKETLSTVRMLKAAVMNEQIKTGQPLTSDEEISVLSRELKQRKYSLAEFSKAQRADLVSGLEKEIKVVERYLPQQLNEAEVHEIVAETIKQVNASSKADFGKVMGAVMPKVKGRADGKLVNAAVKSLLG